MFDKKSSQVILPNPVDCKCGGKLLPIFRPVTLVSRDYYCGERKFMQDGINEVIWKCSECSKIVEG